MFAKHNAGKAQSLLTCCRHTNRLYAGGKNGAQQSTACLDPSVEDPEGWDCDCLEKMVETCGGLSEECLKNRMCKIEKVCDAWKEQHCSSEMIATHKNTSTKVARQESALVSRRTKPEANVGDSLDNSLQGKCSQ